MGQVGIVHIICEVIHAYIDNSLFILENEIFLYFSVSFLTANRRVFFILLLVSKISQYSKTSNLLTEISF